MVSGVSFKSDQASTVERKQYKTRLASRGLVVVFVLLVLSLLLWGFFLFRSSSLENRNEELATQITTTQSDIKELINTRAAGFARRSIVVERNLQSLYPIEAIVAEIEQNIVSRVVVKSMQYDVDNNGAATLHIVADADTFDVMAQQVAILKQMPIFAHVALGEMERNDANRLVFSARMTLADAGVHVYTAPPLASQPEPEAPGNTDTTATPENTEEQEAAQIPAAEEIPAAEPAVEPVQ